MNKIIFPTDFSATANKAKEYALYLAKKMTATVHILHVVPNILIDPANERFAATEVFPSIKQVSGLLDQFETDHRLQQRFDQQVKYFETEGIECTTHVSFGSVSQQVNALAQKIDANLVVMGTNGATWLEHEVMGSNSYQVCHQSSIPVITARSYKEITPFDHVLLATDLNIENTVATYKQAKKILNYFRFQLSFLFVNTPAEFLETSVINKRFEQIKQELGINNAQLLVYNSRYLQDGILRVANHTKHLALLVFGNHGYSRFREQIEYSIADRVITSATMPVLSIKIK